MSLLEPTEKFVLCKADDYCLVENKYLRFYCGYEKTDKKNKECFVVENRKTGKRIMEVLYEELDKMINGYEDVDKKTRDEWIKENYDSTEMYYNYMILGMTKYIGKHIEYKDDLLPSNNDEKLNNIFNK